MVNEKQNTMKSTFSILILILIGSCSSSSLNGSNSTAEKNTVITISGEAINSNDCSRKCLRISTINVQMDDCYDEDAQTFNKDCEVDLKSKALYSNLLNTEASYWEEIENEIDDNHDLNAGLPFIVTITKNKESRSFILLRIDKYPTKEYGEFMSQVESIFDNWKNCPNDSK